MKVVEGFHGKATFLSNFYKEPDGLTREHRFQAEKTLCKRGRDQIMKAKTPQEAKRLGSKVVLRPDWEQIKLERMHYVNEMSFFYFPELGDKLLATGDAYLVHVNAHGDDFWGVVRRGGMLRGYNHHGIILMRVREDLMKARQP